MKPPKSRRDLPINDLLLTAIKRITAPLTDPDDFLFTDDNGSPLDTRKIGKDI